MKTLQSKLALLLMATLPLHAENKIPDEYKTGGFYIGCIAYTFDHFSLFAALDKIAECGGKVVELSAKTSLSKDEPNVPFDYHASGETIQKVKDKLVQCNLKAASYAIIPFPTEEAEARKVFEFAKAFGLRSITTESPELIDIQVIRCGIPTMSCP